MATSDDPEGRGGHTLWDAPAYRQPPDAPPSPLSLLTPEELKAAAERAVEACRDEVQRRARAYRCYSRPRGPPRWLD